MKLKIFSLLFIPLIFIGMSCSNTSQVSENTNQNNVETSPPKKETVFRGEHGELTLVGITQNRNMSQYDQGGFFDCQRNYPKTAPKTNCDENKIRDFIWQHWSEKKRGYVVVTYDSQDAVGTSHIFIEPDENENWFVAWRIARNAMNTNGIDDVPKIVTVERVENKPEKGNWALVFKEANGNAVEKMPYFYN